MDIYKEKYVVPYSCYINLTSKCNLRCKHCFGSYSIQHKNELTLEEWKKVIDELVRCKVFFVNISGGEITQSPFFKEFINYLTKKGMHFILTTNGVFSEQIRRIIINNQDYLVGVKISLDGPDAESHGFMRLNEKGEYDPRVFETTLENIMAFKKEKIPITIATVLHKENIKKMDDFQKLIKKINPISWFISPIIPVGRGNVNKFISEFYEYFDGKFWENISKKGKGEKINVNLIDMPLEIDKKGLSAYSCAAALNFCEIHSDGTVSPCTLCRVCIPPKFMKFENIKNKSFQEIWNGEIFNKFRSYMDIGCGGCKMLPKCNKCVAQSFRYFGNGESPTPFCIKNGEKLGIEDLGKFKKKLREKFDMEIK
jgi:MoaA/NifB/PqqE/SkfB family radical SAM enzyme